MQHAVLNILPICCLCSFLLCCSANETAAIVPPTAAQLADFVSKAKITLPPSAQAVGWRKESGMDDAIWLQINMSAPELQVFLNKSPFRAATFTNNDKYQLHQFHDFLPKPPARYRASQQTLPNSQVINLLIDESNATQPVVYLMWHKI